ncbi:uncharacterized protein [Miscanthus floridulus]|uniref:uncharacterized protein isoform X2 n=1 Tax=Miscanthus floridulus TaxID=154761 RepID=UPI0034576D9C
MTKAIFSNLAHELEDLLRKQIIYENHRWYYHFNFTTKQKEADDDHSTGNKLFFAEVSHMQGKKVWEVNCCCMIEFVSKGGHCFGCKNNGSSDMLHPFEADAYTGGHLDGYLPFDFDALSSSDDDDGEYEYLYKDEDEEDEEEEFEVW